MSIRYTLFKAIRDVIDRPDFKGYYAVFDPKEELSYGVFLKGGTPSSRRIGDGKYLERVANLVINVNGGKGADGTLAGDRFCESVTDILSTTFNHEFQDDDIKVILNKTEILGDINSLGYNSYDLPSYSLNFIIYYAGGNINA